MRILFFLKLAANNMKKNASIYLPYVVACILTVAMSYMIESLSLNPGLKEMLGGEILTQMLFLGSKIISLFAAIFLFYTNRFLMKRRKKEFGVFNILGLEKRHLARIIGIETVYVAVLSCVAGLFVGFLFDKIMFLWVTKVIEGEVTLGFFISKKAILTTLRLYVCIFLLIFLNAVRQVYTTKPIALLRESNAGEREPKTRGIMAFFGLLSLGIGYFIALVTKDPVASTLLFFVAVFFVIVGTYLLFTAGSIALLKVLKKKKSYYYKTKHFIGISSMMYRMKQNAVGLANICILSTAVLVVISTTSAMMLGLEDMIETRYPRDFEVYYDRTEESKEEPMGFVRELQKKKDFSVKNELMYTYFSLLTVQEENTFHIIEWIEMGELNRAKELYFLSVDDFNQITGEEKQLDEGEILFYSKKSKFSYPVLKILDKEYKVAESGDSFIKEGILPGSTGTSELIVIPDEGELYELYEEQREKSEEDGNTIRIFYGFDSGESEREQQAFYHTLQTAFEEKGYRGMVDARVAIKEVFMGFYGGFFFLGVFLGIIFIVATVLIMYYKQISEGYEDRERFAIMQKVGLSHDEVKASIRSQILTVFFLPLLVAGIHNAVAFPMISRLLVALNLLNTKLYILCTVVCFLVFAAGYTFLYFLTARLYYRIIKR